MTRLSHFQLRHPSPQMGFLKMAVWTVLSVAAGPASAHTEANSISFPAEAQPISAESLKNRLSGHVFKASLQDGSGWRLQFKGDYLFINLSSGASDSGVWRREGSKLCVEYQRFPSGCSEIRATEKDIYLKRASTGEVARMEVND